MTDIAQIAKGLSEKIENRQIKALSIRQPYPHYIFHKGKDVENRDWPTKGRGWFIIHAGASKVELSEGEYNLPRGGIVGMARIIDCVTEMDSQWFYGRYGFVLRDAFPVPLIPCRGKLSFFMPEQDVLVQLSLAVRAYLEEN